MSTSGGGFGSSRNVRGTATNDNAPAGFIGEYQVVTVASGIAVALTTAVVITLSSLGLTAGDWDVDGVVDFTLAAATVTHFKAGSSTVAATFGPQDSFVDDVPALTAITDTQGEVIPTVRYSLAGLTTVNLVTSAVFSAGAVSAYGTLRARRVR